MNPIQSFFDALPALGKHLRTPQMRAFIGQTKAALGAYYLSVFGTQAYGSPAVPGAYLQKAYPELVRRALYKKTEAEDAAAALALAELILWESGALYYSHEKYGPFDEKTCNFIRTQLERGANSKIFLALMQVQYAYGRHADSEWTRHIDPADRTLGFLDIPGDRGEYDRLARACWDETQRHQLVGLQTFA